MFGRRTKYESSSSHFKFGQLLKNKIFKNHTRKYSETPKTRVHRILNVILIFFQTKGLTSSIPKMSAELNTPSASTPH